MPRVKGLMQTLAVAVGACFASNVQAKDITMNRIPLPADTPIIDERFKDGISK